MFAVFSIKMGEYYINDPLSIRELLTCNGQKKLPEFVKIIPWLLHDGKVLEVTINLLNPDESKDVIGLINSLVEEIEKEDPWVKEVFGVSGPGEGVVVYLKFPQERYGKESLQSNDFSIPIELARLMFKAKTGPFSTTRGKPKPVKSDISVAKNVTEFVGKWIYFLSLP